MYDDDTNPQMSSSGHIQNDVSLIYVGMRNIPLMQMMDGQEIELNLVVPLV